jgi:hypothetical protein
MSPFKNDCEVLLARFTVEKVTQFSDFIEAKEKKTELIS